MTEYIWKAVDAEVKEFKAVLVSNLNTSNILLKGKTVPARVASLTALTCEAIKTGLAPVECCPECHDRSNFLLGKHELRIAGTTKQDIFGFVCCTVQRQMAKPKPLKAKLGIAQAVVTNTPPFPSETCQNPACAACGADPSLYWSYKTQAWLQLVDYDLYGGLHDLNHPAAVHSHICAPQAHTIAGVTTLPEYQAWQCRLPTGSPTFGIKYCSDPVHVACTPAPTPFDVPRLYVHMPEGSLIGAYVDEPFAAAIAQVIYHEKPPF